MFRSTEIRAVTAWIALAVAAVSEVHAVKRRAFVTSVSGTGDLGSWPDASIATGVVAGDTICKARAQDAGLPNASAFRAWLSTSTTDAYCHIQGLSGTGGSSCGGGSLPGAGPWYLSNGVSTFTGTLDEITGSPWKIFRSAFLDENGDPLPTDDAEFWTGTTHLGTVASGDATCANWTSGFGFSQGDTGSGIHTAWYWSAYFVRDCDQNRRLLCLEPGESEVTILGWSPASLAFVTSAIGTGDLASWPEAAGESGLDAGDAICRSLADAARLPAPESFVAWLSTSTLDAAERLTSEGPFRRVDGYAIANSKTQLVDGGLDTSLSVYENGQYLNGPRLNVRTGTEADGTAAPARCLDWTAGDSSEDGAAGLANAARVDSWSLENLYQCSNLQRLYCFSNAIVLFWDGFDGTGDTSRWSAVVP